MSQPNHQALEAAQSGIVSVGADKGRGFIIQTDPNRFVVTAAHCLPTLPPPHTASYTHERTYAEFLAPLGDEASVWAECVFVDPVGDIAVLGEPDNQALYEQAEAFEGLVDASHAFQIGDIPNGKNGAFPGWFLSLDKEWIECKVSRWQHSLWIEKWDDGTDRVVNGLSGSPIVDESGKAIGMITTVGHSGEIPTDSGPNPSLTYNLPGWVLRLLHNCRT